MTSRPTSIVRRILPIEGSESLLHLDTEQVDFFRTLTGIDDEDALKAHIIAVQTKAFGVCKTLSMLFP